MRVPLGLHVCNKHLRIILGVFSGLRVLFWAIACFSACSGMAQSWNLSRVCLDEVLLFVLIYVFGIGMATVAGNHSGKTQAGASLADLMAFGVDSCA